MNLSAYWKPSLVLFAFAAAGAAPWTAPVSVDTAAIAETIKADVAQLVVGLNAHDTNLHRLFVGGRPSPEQNRLYNEFRLMVLQGSKLKANA